MNWIKRCFSKCERLDSQISNISISSTLQSIFLAALSTLLNKKAIQCPNSRARYITPYSICPSIPSHVTSPTRHLPLHMSPPPTPDKPLPLNNTFLKPNQKHRLPRPHLPPTTIVRTNGSSHPTPVTNPLHHASHIGRTIQLTHLLGNTDIRIYQRLIIRNHIFVRICG